MEVAFHMNQINMILTIDRYNVALAVAVSVCLLVGCVSTERSGDEDFNRYVEFCRKTAMTPVDAEDPNDSMSKVDWMVGVSATTQEFDKEYKIVYADRDYLSFYTKEYSS